MSTLTYIEFPPLSQANEDGLLAMGGQLSTSSLVSAYSQGIFPWYNAGQPILWWSPDPRLVLYPAELKVSRSLAKVIRRGDFDIRINTDFDQVIQNCAWRGQSVEVGEAPDTWITQDMTRAYSQLFAEGYAHSVEVWRESNLIGGLYGLALGKVFFGESMFSTESNASKIAMWGLCQWLIQQEFSIIDCQVTNDHLLSLGAREIPRDEFMHYLQEIEINQASTAFSTGSTKFFNDLKPVLI